MEVLVNELLPKLDALATKLGVVGSYLWEAVVRQVIIKGYIELCAGFIVLLGGCYWFIRLYKEARKRSEKCYDCLDASADEVYLVAGIVLLGGVMVGGILLADAIPKLMCPEAYALYNILDFLK